MWVGGASLLVLGGREKEEEAGGGEGGGRREGPMTQIATKTALQHCEQGGNDTKSDIMFFLMFYQCSTFARISTSYVPTWACGALERSGRLYVRRAQSRWDNTSGSC